MFIVENRCCLRVIHLASDDRSQEARQAIHLVFQPIECRWWEWVFWLIENQHTRDHSSAECRLAFVYQPENRSDFSDDAAWCCRSTDSYRWFLIGRFCIVEGDGLFECDHRTRQPEWQKMLRCRRTLGACVCSDRHQLAAEVVVLVGSDLRTPCALPNVQRLFSSNRPRLPCKRCRRFPPKPTEFDPCNSYRTENGRTWNCTWLETSLCSSTR